MADATATCGAEAIPINWIGSVVSDSTAGTDANPPLGECDDAALVRACLDGRTEAFDVIVERHRRTVYRLCYRFVGRHEDATDLSQDVFLRAYRGLRRFRGDSSLATWLYRIGVNVCLNKVSIRTPVLTSLDETAPLPARGEDAAGAVLREERARRVRAAVARLPRKQRATLILRVYQELSHKQIAGVLQTSEGAVKANFFHALGNLKRALAKQDLG
ncbi:MAG: RNA polymerase sigma factor [Acidobacteria bacterium]|nr:RNA polymerase sigma factor [Acidobacteriota bacterium]